MLSAMEREELATRTKAMTIEEMEVVVSNIPLDILEKVMMERLTAHTARLQRLAEVLRGCADESAN